MTFNGGNNGWGALQRDSVASYAIRPSEGNQERFCKALNQRF
jgi:hypothetical protein